MQIKRIRISLIGVAACVAILVLWRMRSRELPDGCIPVFSHTDISSPFPNFWWLSDKELLLFHYPIQSASPTADKGHFSIYNRVTRQETPLPELDQEFRKTWSKESEPTLSADRRWVVWKNKKWRLPPVEDAGSTAAAYEILNAPFTGEDGLLQHFEIKAKPVGGAQHSIQTFKIALPKHCETGETVYSPRGDKIAWLFGCAPRLPDFWPVELPGNDASVQLWVSNIDGSNLHQLGYESVDADLYYDRGTPFLVNLSTLQWLPDGKHLSFIDAYTLYVIPVD